jgi:hypothetical protein
MTATASETAWNRIPSEQVAVPDTDLVMILDDSSSMGHLRNATISGFNEYIETQARLPGRTFVTVVLFNTRVKMISERQPIETLPKLTADVYRPDGMTALYDAVGQTIGKLAQNPSTGTGRVLFVIDTDGEENSSKEYTLQRVQNMIQTQKQLEWAFVFLGANDSQWQGAHLGTQSTGGYTSTASGVYNKYANLATNTTMMRGSAKSFSNTISTQNYNTTTDDTIDPKPQ